MLAVFALEQNLAARAGHLGELQGGWGGERGGGIMPESNPPAGRFRTKNLFSTSGVTFY